MINEKREYILEAYRSLNIDGKTALISFSVIVIFLLSILVAM